MGSYDSSNFNVLRNLHAVSLVATPFHIPSNTAQGILSSTPVPTLTASLITVLTGVKWYLTVVLT